MNIEEAYEELKGISADGLTADQLDDLVHRATALAILQGLTDEPSPGWAQAGLRFCKDNDIAGLPVPGSAQEMLKKKLGPLPFEQTGTD
jgi:hypothetical protein